MKAEVEMVEVTEMKIMEKKFDIRHQENRKPNRDRNGKIL